MNWEELLELFPSISSLLNTGFILSATVILFKYVFPKLAKKEWMDANIAELSTKYTEIFKDIEELMSLFKTIKSDLFKIEKVLEIMTSYSNLGDSPKTMIRAILESSGYDKEELAKDAKQIMDDLEETTKTSIHDIGKSALEKLSEDLDEGE